HRRRIQVVPSLVIFRKGRASSRRRKVKDLLLLVARVGVILCLSALLAQPFLEIGRALPLPRLEGSASATAVLGVLVDDSLTAFDGREEAARLAHARAWILSSIDRLPPGSAVVLATTSYPRPTGLLSPQE